MGAEQLSSAGKQGTHFVELLLQRRISHVPHATQPVTGAQFSDRNKPIVRCRYA